MMKRRDFITLLGGAAAAWPLAARAQQPDGMRRIGVLVGGAGRDPVEQARPAAFLDGLQQLGWTDGRNVRIDTRCCIPRKGSLGLVLPMRIYIAPATDHPCTGASRLKRSFCSSVSEP